MSVEKITSRILDDARERAEEILIRAQDEKMKILAHAKRDAERGGEEIKQIAQKNAKKNIEKTQSLADLEGKKEVLRSKQECLSKVYEMALQKICDMEDKEYFGLLKEMVGKADLKESAVIVFNERDKKRYNFLTVKLLDFGLKISEETGNFKAGFILKMGDTSLNCTFDEILRRTLDDHKKEIADILFKKGMV